jgi:phytoene dehydrogenase-like protein
VRSTTAQVADNAPARRAFGGRRASARMTRPARQTAIVIGAGHNGLVCAFYLARAGFAVTVLERRDTVGGAAVTEEFHPGFRNSVASYTVSLLAPKVIADMGLHERGLRIVERPISNFLPLDNSRYLKVGGGLERTQAEFAKFSARDAQALPAYYAMLDGIGDLLRELSLQTPPDLGVLLHSGARGVRQARVFSKLTIEQRRDLLDLFSESAADFLDGWFEADPVKAAFAFDGVVGNLASPWTPGSAYVLLHHTFGGVNGKKGQWGHAVGGMGAITQAMARACRDAGVTIELQAPVEQLLVEQGRVRGVRLQGGGERLAGVVAANVNPRLLFERMTASEDLPETFRRRIARYRCESGTFRMNVALSELPRFACLPGPGEHLQSGIIMAPSMAYMDRAWRDAVEQGWSRRPIVEMLIPSTVDDSLAPAGAHVASLFCQHFRYALPGGRTWDDARDETADLIVDTVEQFAPGFRRSVVGRVALAPLDLERKFGLLGGDIMHGHMSLDQLWAARPMLGHGDYRTPIAGLYLCGAGTHPGGGVTGMPGHNAAREIRRDASRLTALKLALAGE